MNNPAFSKIWIIVIVVILIAGGFFAWQYFGPKEGAITDKTANWKVYQNESCQYEIKYPSDLDIGEKKFEEMGLPIETALRITWEFPLGDTPNSFKSVTVEIKDNSEKKSLLSILGYDPAFCKIGKEEDVFAKINCEMEQGTLQMIGAAYSKNDIVYTVSLIMMGSEDLSGMDFSSEINTYNLMLSTLKFLGGEVIAPSQIRAKDVRVMADMSMIVTAASLYYDKSGSYSNLASDGDVENLQKQIQNEIGERAAMITSRNAFCADVTLSDGKTKYCIDSEGRRDKNLGCSKTKLICISY